MNPSEFAELRHRVVAAGCFKKSWMPTMLSFAWATLLLLGSLSVFFLTENVALILLNAVLLAWVYGRFGLLAHDFGHMQVFRRTGLNDFWGNVSATVVGLSYYWWKDKHNAHHAHTNHDHMDPDIDLPVLAYSEAQAQRKRGLARWMVKHQAWFFFPIQLLAAESLRSSSWIYIFRKANRHRFGLDFTLSVLHVALYALIIFGTQRWWLGILFIILHQKLWSAYITSIFAPNHKGMPILEGQTIDFMREQILTARNIHPNFFVDCYYGHLNYQIEHHLFPTMPRRHSRKAREVVRAFCQEKGIDYHETGVIRSYIEIIRHMRQVSLCLR